MILRAFQSGSPSEWETVLWFSWSRSLFFGMLTLKQDPFRRVYYVGIKCAISKDTGFAKSSWSRLVLFWKAALILWRWFKKKQLFCQRESKGQSSHSSSCFYKLYSRIPRFIWGGTWKLTEVEKKIAFIWVRTENLAELQSKKCAWSRRRLPTLPTAFRRPFRALRKPGHLLDVATGGLSLGLALTLPRDPGQVFLKQGDINFFRGRMSTGVSSESWSTGSQLWSRGSACWSVQYLRTFGP